MNRTYTLLLTTICAITLFFSSCSNQSFSSLQKSNELTLAKAENTTIKPVEIESIKIDEEAAESPTPAVAEPISVEEKTNKSVAAKPSLKYIKNKVAQKSRDIVKAPVLASKKITAGDKAEKKASAFGLLGWALIFLIIAIVAAVLGFGALSATAATIAQVLFIIFLIIFAIFLLLHLLS